MLVRNGEEEGPVDRLRLRLRVWRQRARLDVALAEGADPASSSVLALRAQQLTRLATLSAIGTTIRTLLDAAEEPPRTWGQEGPRPPLQREAVLAAREELLTLAGRLASARDAPPQGAAPAALMVWDSASPVYATQAETTVAGYARAVTKALGPIPHVHSMGWATRNARTAHS